MSKVLRDPTNEATPALLKRPTKPMDLKGKVVGFLDISKPRGDLFLDQLEKRFIEHGMRVERYRKPTFSKPAPIDLRMEIAQQCDLVIEALAD